MKPEYTAYQNSPHAKVACVACHVGEGADWYVRSKLSGLYQVYAVTLGIFQDQLKRQSLICALHAKPVNNAIAAEILFKKASYSKTLSDR